MATERIQIVVSSKGTVSVKREIDDVGKSAKAAASGVTMLKGTLSGFSISGIDRIRSTLDKSQSSAVLFGSALSRAAANANSISFGKLGAQAAAESTKAVTALERLPSVFTRIKASAASMVGSVTSSLGRLTSFRSTVAAVGPAAGGSGLAVANLAAQFNDIGVTAAASMNPLQIALQQGTQISQVFSQQGAAGSVRMLGQAFLSVISPVSILTIAGVALIAAFLQWVDWSKVAVATLSMLSNGITLFRANIQTLAPYLITIGTYLAVAFGPAVLASIWAIISAVGVGAVNAFLALNAAILANPIALFAAGIALLITYTVGWKSAIEAVIAVWGRVLEVIGRVTDAMGWTSGLAEKGIQIYMNADKAAADLVMAGEKMGASMLTSVQSGASSLSNSIKTSSDAAIAKKEAADKRAAEKLKNAIEAGSINGAKTLSDSIQRGMANAAISTKALIENAQQRAIATFEQANGIASTAMSTAIVTSSKTGAQYMYNSITGAVSTIPAKVTPAIVSGGNTAAGAIKSAMTQGAATVFSSIESAFATLAPIYDVINAYKTRARYENAKILAEISKLRAEALAINTRPSNRMTTGYASGGQFKVGGTGSGTDTTPVRFNANRGERVTVETRKQQRVNDNAHNNNAAPNVDVPVSITNVFDPSAIPAATESRAGQRAVVNVLRANRDEIMNILGIA